MAQSIQEHRNEPASPGTVGTGGGHGEQRVDIQWMRALAVGLVLLFHFWPKRLPGGFIGVDIFFVISGFLITSHLLTKPPRSFSGVVAFWGRRVRRLLPAAFTVIIVTLVAVLLISPVTQWELNGKSVIFAGLYVENWHLAWTAVDYLAATEEPSALQHYWSLSVEEQFYLVWPLLIAAVAFAVRRRWRHFRRATGVAVGAVVVASLAWSVYFTQVNPEEAYFVTPTRMWELGVGGALAVLYPRIARRLAAFPALKVALVTLGCAMILWASFAITGDGFPGWIALVPVVGAALVIGAGPADYRVSFDRVLKLRPFQFLGDISYSVYLWHWPFVILVPQVLGHSMKWPIKLGMIALVLLLAWASKTQIEDRFRGTHPLGVPLRRTFIFLVTGMLVVAGAGGALTAVTAAMSKSYASPEGSCVGAAVRLDPECRSRDPHGDGLLMTPVQAAADKNVAYEDGCWWIERNPGRFPTCRYGSENKRAPQVSLYGNSHAGPWLDPLIAIADDRGWALKTHLASRCFPSNIELKFSTPAAGKACLDYTARTIKAMKSDGTQLIVMSVRVQSVPVANVPTGGSSTKMLTDMYAEMLEDFAANKIHVLVIHDVPLPPDNVIDCVAENLDDVAACDSPRKNRVLPDPLFAAANASDSIYISAVDFADAMCDETTCWDVVGGLIAYFDKGHMTSRFTNTFRPWLAAEIDAFFKP